MADINGNGKLHIAMLPWQAFGHIIPFLELAKLMAAKGHKISFISTPRNIHRLPQIPSNLTPFINLIKIELPKVQNLPQNAESTKDLPFNKVKYLKIASDGLKKPITDFLKTSSPDWFICDFCTYWLGPIAAEHGVLTAYFSVFPAAVLCLAGPAEVLMYGDNEKPVGQRFMNRARWVPFETEVKPSLFQITRSLQDLTGDEENINDGYRLGATVQGCDAVIVRSSYDFEPEWLNLLKIIYRKPIIPSGLLPAEVADDHACWGGIREWLDKHEKGTVVYIGFGTETKPNQYELTQLALGLELCNLPFYWVLIDRRGSSDDEVIELPRGFEERTRGRGVVCREWAPQFKILSHDSVGGLLIHSDQGVIASYLVEKKMAYMVHRNELDGSFSPESLADSLSLVMVKEEGKMYRDKAKELMSMFGGKDTQDKCLEELLQFLQKSLK
ncbi:hypothetical protein LXL04_024895 [Taraxacum kok-saghyz]